MKLDAVFLMGSKILSAQSSIIGNFRDDVTFDVERPPEDVGADEHHVLFVQGFILGDEYYCASCAMRSSFADDRMIFTQSGPLQFLEAQLLSDFEADLQRYQRKMMRVSRTNVCVTYLTEGTHETETTAIDDTSEGAAVDEPQQAEG